MYEITYEDKETLAGYIGKRMAYDGGIYDFTFEGRYIIYHARVMGEWHYIALDMTTGVGSVMYRGKKPLRIADKYMIIPYICNAIKYTGDRRYGGIIEANPIEIIDSTFRYILPKYGFNVREEQIELSKRIFRGFTSYDVSLCEAEVGSGKSLAYLVAGVVARKHFSLSTPITISTATIELQNALVEKEIPRLSEILMDSGFIYRPLKAIVRKGKEHFFCRFRYEDFIEKLSRNPEKHDKILALFNETDIENNAFDLDKLRLPGSVKKKICVSGGCGKCEFRDDCRYYSYSNHDARRSDIDFQVTNHNQYLMSEKLGAKDQTYLLKPSGYVIIDEAHRLKEAAADVYGERLCERDIPKYINEVKTLCTDENRRNIYKDNMDTAVRLNARLFEIIRGLIRSDDREDGHGTIFTVDTEMTMLIRQLRNTIESLEASRNRSVVVHGRYILHTLDTLISSSKILTWAETDENGTVTLCCCPKNVGREMYKYLWSNGHHHILTSGTMSDGRSFEYFEKESGVYRIRKYRKQYSSTPSPFDYANNTRLYLPGDLPIPSDASDEKYVSAIAERITELVKVTHGHTAILFTSYRILNAVYEKVKDKIGEYELIRMTRSNRNAIRDFKKKDNAVLFASGSMWEGVDCAGDKLSSVIIVRLPFPLRSAAMEEKKSASANVDTFINEYAVPEMLIKLRQGVGRLIRCETDAGLISVLDTRAVRSRYSERVQAVLSKYSRVENLDEIREFFNSVKSKEYFEE